MEQTTYGIPHGSVFGPTLCNLFYRNLPTTVREKGTKLVATIPRRSQKCNDARLKIEDTVGMAKPSLKKEQKERTGDVLLTS